MGGAFIAFLLFPLLMLANQNSTAQSPLFFTTFDPYPSLTYLAQSGNTLAYADSFFYVGSGYVQLDNQRVMTINKLTADGKLIKSRDIKGPKTDISLWPFPYFSEQNQTFVHPISYSLYDTLPALGTYNAGLVRTDTALNLEMTSFLTDDVVNTIFAASVLPTEDGGYVFNTPIQHGYDQVVKVDHDGKFEWNLVIPDDSLYFYKRGYMVQTEDEHCLLASMTDYPPGKPPFGFGQLTVMTKFTSNGQILWQKTMPPIWRDPGGSLKMSPLKNGNIAYLHLTDSLFSESAQPYRLYGIDSLANILWQVDWRHLPGVKTIANIQTTADGDILGCGWLDYTHLTAQNATLAWVFKVSADGQKLWDRFYSGDELVPWRANIWFEYMTEMPDGRIAITGAFEDEPTIHVINPLLVVLDENGCLDPLDCPNNEVIYVNTTEKAKEEVFPLTLSPNPTSGLSTLTLPSSLALNGLTIEVHSIHGKQMFQKEIQQKQMELDLSAFGAGLYFVTLKKQGLVIGSSKLFLE